MKRWNNAPLWAGLVTTVPFTFGALTVYAQAADAQAVDTETIHAGATHAGATHAHPIYARAGQSRYVEPYVNAAHWLETQVVIGELKQDPELVKSAIQRWIAIAPMNADALFAQARWLTRQDEVAKAQSILRQLEATYQAQQLKQYIALHTSKQTAYNQILLLQRGGQYTKALRAFDQLFGETRPDVEYELEYLALKSALPQYRQSTLAAYRALDQRYPNVAAIEMPMARHLARYGEVGQATQIYRRLLSDPNWGLAAATAWANVLSKRVEGSSQGGMDQGWMDNFTYLASQYPNNLGIQQQYETARQAWQREQQLRRDPLYQAKRQLLANLKRDRYLDRDEQALQRALKKWPRDPELWVALSQFQYHRKQYDAALESLKTAQRFDDDPDLLEYYQSRLTMVRFWAQLDSARQRLASQQFSQALQGVNRAIAINASIALAYSVKGQILLAQGQPKRAFEQAQHALQLSPDSEVALRLWVLTRYPDQGVAGEWRAINSLPVAQQQRLSDERADILLRYTLERLAQLPSIEMPSPELPSTQVPSARLPLERNTQSNLQGNQQANPQGNTQGNTQDSTRDLLAQSIAVKADRPWQKRALADQMVRLGERVQAEQMMRAQYRAYPTAETAHAAALFFSGLGDIEQAYALVTAQSWTGLSTAEADSFERIKRDYHLHQIAERELSGDALAQYLLTLSQQDRPLAVQLWAEMGFSQQAQQVLVNVDWQQQSDAELERYSQVAYLLRDVEDHQAILAQARTRSMPLPMIALRQQALDADQALSAGNYDFAAQAYLALIERDFPVPQASLDSLLLARPEYAQPIVQARMARLSLTPNTIQHLAQKQFAQSLSAQESSGQELSAQKQAWLETLALALSSRQQAEVKALDEMARQYALDAFDYWQLQEAALAGEQYSRAEQYAEQALLLDDKARYQLAEPRDLASAYRYAEGRYVEGRYADGHHPEGSHTEEPSIEGLSPQESWMTQDLIGTLDRLRERRSASFTFGAQWNFDPTGTQTLTLPMELKWSMSPLFEDEALWGWQGKLGEGHWLVRTETVVLQSGDLDFRSQDPTVPSQGFSDHALGQGLGIGWQSERLQWDIGTSPMGFKQRSWVGGFALNQDFGDWRFGMDVSRRSLTSSFISFAGAELTTSNPATQNTTMSNSTSDLAWGGVMKTGLSLSASWHDGGPWGGWGFVERHALTGHNVADNWRNAAMVGGYYTHFSDQQAELSSGMSFFYMGYDKNLGEVAYGHGDYYSPERYLSLGANLRYLHRINYDWTFGVRAGVSLSSVSSGEVYQFDDASDDSMGLGGNLALHTEYRINPNWSLVGALSQQISSDYQPSVVSVYMRYHFDANWQKAKLLPQEWRPYSEFN